MTDKEWAVAIRKASDAAVKHRELIAVAETEYEARYGHNPSDIDDDWWIDTVHLGGLVYLDKIKEQAEFSIKLKKGK